MILIINSPAWWLVDILIPSPLEWRHFQTILLCILHQIPNTTSLDASKYNIQLKYSTIRTNAIPYFSSAHPLLDGRAELFGYLVNLVIWRIWSQRSSSLRWRCWVIWVFGEFGYLMNLVIWCIWSQRSSAQPIFLGGSSLLKLFSYMVILCLWYLLFLYDVIYIYSKLIWGTLFVKVIWWLVIW